MEKTGRSGLWTLILRVIVIGSLPLAVVVNLLSLLMALSWVRQPYMGLLLEHTMVISSTQGEGFSLPHPELTNPNRLLKANGQPVPNQAALSHILKEVGLGGEITYEIECQSGEGWRTSWVTLPVVAFPGRDFLALFLVPYFIGLVYLAAGIWVYHLKSDTSGGRTFAFLCAWLAIFTGTFFDVFSTHYLVPLWTASMALVAAGLIHLALVFPEEKKIIRRYPFLRFLPYMVALLLIILSEFYLYNRADPRSYFLYWRLSYTYIWLALILFFALMLHARLLPSSPATRQQARIILLGGVLSFSPIALWVGLASLGINVYFRPELYFPFLIIFPITIAYAILRYHLLDVNLIVSRGLLYSALTVMMVGTYFLAVALPGQLLNLTSPGTHPIFLSFFVLAMMLAMGPMRSYLQGRIDRIFYKDRLDYRLALQDFSRALTTTLEMPRLFELLLGRIGELLHTERAMIFMYEQEKASYLVQRAMGVSEQAARSVQFDRQDQAVRWLTESGKPLYLDGAEGDFIPPGFPLEERARLLALKLTLCVSLKTKAQLIGWLALGPKLSGDLYSREDLNFLSAIADQSAIALQNALLYQRTEERARELSTLIEIGRAVTSTLDLQTLLRVIMDKVVEILDAEAASLLLLDEAGRELSFQIALGPIDEKLKTLRVPVGTGIAGTVAKEGKPLIVNDVTRDPRWWTKVDEVTQFSTQSILCVPLISRERVIGVLEAVNKRDNTLFTKEEADLLSSFAAQAAIAIENARLYTMTDKALAKRLQELATLQEIDRQLNATLDFDRVMELTLDWALAVTESDTGVIAMTNEDRTGMVILAGRGYPEGISSSSQPWPLDKGITGRVIRTGRPALVPDVSQDPDYVEVIPSTRSQLTVPIMREEEVIGVITLESAEPGKFSEDDLNFMLRLADHAAIAITNAKLYADLKIANDAKSEFVSIASHELKIPMTSIKGYARLLDMGAAGPVSEKQRDFLQVISANVDRMEALVRDLLDISRIETGRLTLEREAFDLQPLLDEVLQGVQKEIEGRSLSLKVDLPPKLPLVWADRARVGQVLTNLLSNAYKYTPKGGRITVNMRPAAPLESQDGEAILISVSDTGIGISPEDQVKIFTKFFRADHPLVQEIEGTGLGLSITKSIIELHGGRIWVESQPGQGSTFYFTLPIASSEPPLREVL